MSRPGARQPTVQESEIARRLIVLGPTTRSALSEQLGLSYSSTSRATQGLVAAGVVTETSTGATTAGRPTMRLSLVPQARRVIGVVLHEQAITAVSANLSGTIVRQHNVTGLPAGTTAEQIVERVAGVVHELRADLSELDAVCVSVGGKVTDRATIARAAYWDWPADFPLGQTLQDRVGVPVSVCNDVYAICQAQAWYGVGRLDPSFGMVTIGQGLGFGSVVNGVVAERLDDGHLLCHAPTGGHRECRLGHRGCAAASLERDNLTVTVAGRPHPATFASVAEAISTGYLRGVGRVDDPGEPAAIMDDASAAAGHLVASLAGALQTRTIVVAGMDAPLVCAKGSRFWDVLADRQRVGVFDHPNPEIEIHFAGQAYGDWALGAAAVAMHQSLGWTFD